MNETVPPKVGLVLADSTLVGVGFVKFPLSAFCQLKPVSLAALSVNDTFTTPFVDTAKKFEGAGGATWKTIGRIMGTLHAAFSTYKGIALKLALRCSKTRLWSPRDVTGITRQYWGEMVPAFL